MNTQLNISELSRLARGRVTLVLGESLCKNEILKEVSNSLAQLREELDIECVVSLCSNPAIRELFSRVLELYTIENSQDIRIPKHKLDSFLKCVFTSDTLLVVFMDVAQKPIADVIPLAVASNRTVILLSSKFKDLDWLDRGYIRLDI